MTMNKRMPQLFVKTTQPSKKIKSLLVPSKIKTWWRQLVVKKSSSDKSDASSHTTLDWRSLSPDRPPLPFFLPESPTSSTTSINNANERSIPNKSSTSNNSSLNNILSNNTTTTPTTITIDNNNLDSYNNKSTTASSNNNSSNKPTRTNTDERNYQPLCPILEESETMITESTGSNVIINNSSRLSPGSMHEDEVMSSAESNTSSLEQHHRSVEKQPLSPKKSSSIIETPVPAEVKAVQKTPSDRYMSDDIVGDEERCKRKFAKMVLAANKFQTQQEKNDRPSHMALLFDVHGNIDMMRMVRQGKSEYHKFCGNSQYVPPELSVNIEYQSELADIWVLGIFLYRMLVGKYPFSASNDQQLFKKMLHGNFSIPNELSEDAKDLLRRMLAPDSTRASLDLVIYHPWLKSYRPLLLDHYYSTSKATNPTTKTDYFNNNHHPIVTPPLQQRNTTIRRSNSVHTTSFDDKPTTTASKKSSFGGKKIIKKAILLLVQGPFPPPRKPYQDLSHLGTRESVFARQRQQV